MKELRGPAIMSRAAAERALIATLMAHPAAIGRVRKQLRPEHMAPGIRRSIYEACLRVDDGGEPLDPSLVLVALPSSKQGKATAEFVVDILPELAVPTSRLPLLVRRVVARRPSKRR